MARGHSKTYKAMKQKAAAVSRDTGVPHDVHHRHPRSRKASYQGKHINEERNLTILPQSVHRAWHEVVSNRTPDEIAAWLTEKFISPDYYLVAVPRKKKQPKQRQKRRYCTDCECEVLKFIPKTSKENPDG